ncbi:transforming growth factor beta-1-induced transcript 1 protein [Drosophila ficusphila]|uniref:transforming growth factor beta-1-induced transcript 1 protein n=1 Tax=Drosophila ficusphila TaxID=30025 RepID=UPI0007E826B0|nr:transforming growth factor beta-1-induced transcript 1 protein [Drosophila ficusphila]
MSPSICCRCNEEIWPRAICSSGKAYHPHHFTCRNCSLVVDPALFFAVDDDVVCSECYLGNHAARCSACRTPILERAVAAVGRKWHEKCFRCVSCGKPLISSGFYEVNGYLFCNSHFRELFSSRCAGCAGPIEERAVVALSTKWHQKCFRCSICRQRIVTGEFRIVCGRPICLGCKPIVFGPQNCMCPEF